MGCLKLTERDYIQLHDYSTYNADGMQMSITDNQGRVKTYDRDKMGRIIKELFPNKQPVGSNLVFSFFVYFSIYLKHLQFLFSAVIVDTWTSTN